jgi:hypothetical protein
MGVSLVGIEHAFLDGLVLGNRVCIGDCCMHLVIASAQRPRL